MRQPKSSYSNDYVSVLIEDMYLLREKTMHKINSALWEKVCLTDKREFLQCHWKPTPLSPSFTCQYCSFIQDKDLKILEAVRILY